MNPYHCPDSVYVTLQATDSFSFSDFKPLIRAVAKLGPTRVRWLGSPAKKDASTVAVGDNLTCWALDQRRARHNALLIAAGFEELLTFPGRPSSKPPQSR